MKLWVKILIPVLVVLLIAAIWLVKNPDALQTPEATVPLAIQPSATPEAMPEEASEETTEKTAEEAPPAQSASPTEEPPDRAGADFSLETTEMVDFDALAQHSLPIIVDYGSDSCIPCKAMAPVLETLNAELAGKAFIKFVDVWKYGAAAGNVPVQVIPTQVLVNADGTPFTPSESLVQSVGNFMMYSHRETGEHVFTVHQGGLTEPQMREILKEMGVE